MTSCSSIGSRTTAAPGEVTSHFVGGTTDPPAQGPNKRPKEASRPQKGIHSPSGTALPSTQRASPALRGPTAGSSTNAPTATNATRSSGSVTSLPKTLHPVNKQNHPAIATPIRTDRLEYHLKRSAYDEELTQYLIDGFINGFKLGHENDAFNTNPRNQKSVSLYASVVKQKLEAELGAGRMAGPFTTPPFSPFQVSPLGVREKKTKGKYRLIHDLSYPYDGTSVNANIPQQQKTVKYSTVGSAIRKLLQLPQGSFTAKCDMKDAYRMIPVHPSEYPKLGIYFQGQYYYDKCLAMGCGSACKIFETFATAIHHIYEFYNPNTGYVHMLDDSLVLNSKEDSCQYYLDRFTKLCDDIGIPWEPSKTTKPSTNTVFLGVELDTTHGLAKLPADKLAEYRLEVEETLKRKCITRAEMESLAGKLSWASCVVPARPFLRRLFDLVHSVKKPFYKIRITQEVRADLDTWLTFMQEYNGITYFRSLNIIPSDVIQMSADACGLGFGAYFGPKWIQARFPESWDKCHIGIRELYPIYVLISMFGTKITNSTVLFLTDSRDVSCNLNKQSSTCKISMHIIRSLILKLVSLNIHLTAKHIPGKTNILADKISRFQVTPQLLSAYGMETTPTPIPPHLLPGNFMTP